MLEFVPATKSKLIKLFQGSMVEKEESPRDLSFREVLKIVLTDPSSYGLLILFSVLSIAFGFSSLKNWGNQAPVQGLDIIIAMLIKALALFVIFILAVTAPIFKTKKIMNFFAHAILIKGKVLNILDRRVDSSIHSYSKTDEEHKYIAKVDLLIPHPLGDYTKQHSISDTWVEHLKKGDEVNLLVKPDKKQDEWVIGLPQMEE